MRDKSTKIDQPPSAALNFSLHDHFLEIKASYRYWLEGMLHNRTEKIVPVHRVSFCTGVLRDCLLRRRWMLKLLGKI